jgi:hypothetical protein
MKPETLAEAEDVLHSLQYFQPEYAMEAA